MIAGKDPLLTPDSTSSIEELFEKVNVLYLDILHQSVAGYFGGKRRQSTLRESICFSLREEEYAALVEENDALREVNDALRRQFEITKGEVHDPVSVKKANRKWLKAHDSGYDADKFSQRFLSLADYVANAGKKMDFQQIMGALSENRALNKELSDA